MGLIEVKQRNESYLPHRSKWAEGVAVPVDPPSLLWVVYEGEQVVGIYANWEEASTMVGTLYQRQLTRMLLREKQRLQEQLDEKNGSTPKP